MENYLEIFGTIFGFLMVFCSIYQKRITWVLNCISAGLYICIFFNTKLYANMTIFIYYVIASIYGWCVWGKEKTHLKITYCSTLYKINLLIIFSILLFSISLILLNFTDSQMPFADSLISSLSIIATWLNARKKVEAWYIWIVVNVFGVGLYFSQDLYLTSILYFIFIILSIQGYYQWKKEYKTIK